MRSRSVTSPTSCRRSARRYTVETEASQRSAISVADIGSLLVAARTERAYSSSSNPTTAARSGLGFRTHTPLLTGVATDAFATRASTDDLATGSVRDLAAGDRRTSADASGCARLDCGSSRLTSGPPVRNWRSPVDCRRRRSRRRAGRSRRRRPPRAARRRDRRSRSPRRSPGRLASRGALRRRCRPPRGGTGRHRRPTRESRWREERSLVPRRPDASSRRWGVASSPTRLGRAR